MMAIGVSPSGIPYVWNADDWLTLREKHRIVGELHGMVANLPIQEHLHGLPLALLQEEATLLVEKNIARLIKFPSLERCPGQGIVESYKKHRQEAYTDQDQKMRGERKEALTGLIDKIIEGRRRKQLGLDTKKKKTKSKQIKLEGEVKEEKCEELSVKQEHDESITDVQREAVLHEELSKIPPLSKENTLVQTFTAYPWLSVEDACPIEWKFPLTPNEKIRYMTFKDLWEQGYYITSGHKFGGDFLVYPGDPVKFHSQFLVICVDHLASIAVQQLVCYGRIGSSVRKTVVLASLIAESSKVHYQSIQWPGASLSTAT